MKLSIFAVTLWFLGVSIGLPYGESVKWIPSYAGPYQIRPILFANVSDDYPTSTGKLWLRLRVTQARGKQLQYGWGQAYISVPVTDDMKVEVRMAKRSNNQWKQNAFVFNFDRACTNFYTYGYSIVNVMLGSDIPRTCPSPVLGLKEIKNQTLNLEFKQFPVMPYGHYLFTLAVKNSTEVLGVAVVEASVVPKL